MVNFSNIKKGENMEYNLSYHISNLEVKEDLLSVNRCTKIFETLLELPDKIHHLNLEIYNLKNQISGIDYELKLYKNNVMVSLEKEYNDIKNKSEKSESDKEKLLTLKSKDKRDFEVEKIIKDDSEYNILLDTIFKIKEGISVREIELDYLNKQFSAAKAMSYLRRSLI
jgi:hypothetical protein